MSAPLRKTGSALQEDALSWAAAFLERATAIVDSVQKKEGDEQIAEQLRDLATDAAILLAQELGEDPESWRDWVDNAVCSTYTRTDECGEDRSGFLARWREAAEELKQRALEVMAAERLLRAEHGEDADLACASLALGELEADFPEAHEVLAYVARGRELWAREGEVQR